VPARGVLEFVEQFLSLLPLPCTLDGAAFAKRKALLEFGDGFLVATQLYASRAQPI
jgi:hypothetical protein